MQDVSKSSNRRKIKICFAASSGGHYEQLMMLQPLMDKYDSFVLTEKVNYKIKSLCEREYYVMQVNRKEKLCFLKLIIIGIKEFKIFIKEKPDVVISTGVLGMIPMCIFCKLFKKKLIYIESFAKVTSPTLTGKLLYKYADQFYVQWLSMKEVYPNAIYLGGIY